MLDEFGCYTKSQAKCGLKKTQKHHTFTEETPDIQKGVLPGENLKFFCSQCPADSLCDLDKDSCSPCVVNEQKVSTSPRSLNK